MEVYGGGEWRDGTVFVSISTPSTPPMYPLWPVVTWSLDGENVGDRQTDVHSAHRLLAGPL